MGGPEEEYLWLGGPDGWAGGGAVVVRWVWWVGRRSNCG
jgi:hypothetical protein